MVKSLTFGLLLLLAGCGRRHTVFDDHDLSVKDYGQKVYAVYDHGKLVGWCMRSNDDLLYWYGDETTKYQEAFDALYLQEIGDRMEIDRDGRNVAVSNCSGEHGSYGTRGYGHGVKRLSDEAELAYCLTFSTNEFF